MTPEERAEIRRHIEKEIESLERSIETLADLNESEVQSDANDWFTSKESNRSKEINEMTLVKARQKIISLRGVLKRIDNPDFGNCTVCNKPIPVGRLKIVPNATRCMEC